MFGWIRKIFRRKKDVTEEIPAETALHPSTFPSAETASTENVKAKLDLVLTQLESLNLRYESLNGRMQNLERMISEIHEIAKKP